MQKPFDYISEAQQTKSSSFHPELFSNAEFMRALADVIDAANALDRVKKALFYGKPVYPGRTSPVISHAGLPDAALAMAIGNEPLQDLIHGIIGKATEAGELIEALFTALGNRQYLDLVNVAEEIGDGFWYDAILANVIGASFDSIQRTNIAKLRKRFPERFTEYDAQNRDLAGERVLLEKTERVGDLEVRERIYGQGEPRFGAESPEDISRNGG